MSVKVTKTIDPVTEIDELKKVIAETCYGICPAHHTPGRLEGAYLTACTKAHEFAKSGNKDQAHKWQAEANKVLDNILANFPLEAVKRGPAPGNTQN